MMDRFRVVRQHDGMQCGVACMAMICRHYDKGLSISWLESLCHASREGVSLKALHDLSIELGMDSVAGKVSLDDLYEVPLPCILHWNQNHFVVLYKISDRHTRFWIADPGKGKYRCDIKEMKQHWISTESNGVEKGIAMFLEPNDRFGSIREGKPERRSFRFMMGYLRQYKRYFFQIFCGLLLGCLLQLIMPFLTQSISVSVERMMVCSLAWGK